MADSTASADVGWMEKGLMADSIEHEEEGWSVRIAGMFLFHGGGHIGNGLVWVAKTPLNNETDHCLLKM